MHTSKSPKPAKCLSATITVFLFMVLFVFPTHHPLHHLSTILKCNVLPQVFPIFGKGGGRKMVAEKKEMQPTQQISITGYARSSQSYRVINCHVAAVQLRIALVRCSQCNKMQ